MNTRRWPLQDEANPDKGGAGGGDKKNEDLGTVEDRARRMGWSPQEEFRGDKAKWVDATTFVKNGEESLPILRERLRSMERSNIELGKSVVEFKKMSDTAFDRAYTKAKKELQTEIKVAAKEGDDKAVDAATTELANLEKEKAERKVASDKDPVFDRWVEDNAWYKDPDMAIEAEGEAFKIRKKMGSGQLTPVDGVPFLELVKDAMKKRFPEKFGNPRRKEGSGVERSGAGGDETESRGAKGWDKLPKEAQDAGDRYIKQKLYKDKAAYAAAYWAQN